MPLITAVGSVKQKAKKQYVLFWKGTFTVSDEVLVQALSVAAAAAARWGQRVFSPAEEKVELKAETPMNAWDLAASC